MTPKSIVAAALLCTLALAGCTGGSDGDGGSSTSTSGGGGVGGCVTAPGGGACSNATVSGSATYTSTSSSATNSTTNGTSNATMQQTVRIENGAFDPGEVTVKVGGTVTWEHHDGTTTHTVTADDGSFDSSPSCSAPLPIGDCMTNGETFSHTFAVAGSFGYHDKLNTALKGTVHVVQ